MPSWKSKAAAFLSILSTVTSIAVGVDVASPNVASNETSYHRDFFYIGGNYQFNSTLNGTILVDSIYVEKLTPSNGITKTYPLVFFHGFGPTAANWLNTPDNRKGWASYFIDLGYAVYLLDTAGVARSSSNDFTDYPQTVGATVELTETIFSAPQVAMLYPQAINHTQWPGTGLRGDPIFDAFFPTLIPIPTNFTHLQFAMQASGCALLQRIGLSYIISHSAGTVIPLVMSDLCPELVAGAVNLEPDNTPFQLFFPAAVPIDPWGLSEIPVAYDPPVKDPSVDLIKVKVGVDRPGYYACQLQADPPKQYVNISKVPVLVVVGEASIHATWDHCVVNYMRQAGVKVNFTQLGEIGIHGNGHFPFLEKNNLQVAAIIDSWLQNPLTG